MEELEGSISGFKGCLLDTQKFSVCNLYLDKDVTDVKVEWEDKDKCPDETYSIPKRQCQVIEYYDAPESLSCGNLMQLSANVDSTACSAIMNVTSPVLSIFVKSEINNTANCVIATNPLSPIIVTEENEH